MAGIAESITLIQGEHSVLRVFRRDKHLQQEETVFDLRFYSALDGPEICSITITRDQAKSAFGIWHESDWFPSKGI